MKFDQYTIALLLLRPDAPALTEAEEAALQDAHMAHLSELHSRGELLAAGPVPGEAGRELRGFAIYRCGVGRAAEFAAADPGVLAGRYRHEVHPWILPSGLLSFTPGRLPASMAEVGQ